jgi:hypothetical protein
MKAVQHRSASTAAIFAHHVKWRKITKGWTFRLVDHVTLRPEFLPYIRKIVLPPSSRQRQEVVLPTLHSGRHRGTENSQFARLGNRIAHEVVYRPASPIGWSNRSHILPYAFPQQEPQGRYTYRPLSQRWHGRVMSSPKVSDHTTHAASAPCSFPSVSLIREFFVVSITKS